MSCEVATFGDSGALQSLIRICGRARAASCRGRAAMYLWNRSCTKRTVYIPGQEASREALVVETSQLHSRSKSRARVCPRSVNCKSVTQGKLVF